jgi:hypothetical protein
LPGGKEYMNRACLVVLLAVVMLTDASAGILVPPWKGLAGTTHEEWSFGTNANPASPDVVSNPYGSASAAITVGAMGAGWSDDFGLGTKRGIWDLGGSDGRIVLNIANLAAPANSKDIWVQVVFYKIQGMMDAPIVTISGAQFVSGETSLIEADTVMGPGYGWYAYATIWRMQQSPASEQIVLTGNAPFVGSMVDQVVIDTRSAAAAQPVISGSAAIAGVTMNGLPGNPVTGAGGAYSVQVASGWSGTVTPTKTDYVFTPSSRVYTNVTSDKLAENYTACYLYDLNCNGTVGYDDLAILCSHWLESGPAVVGDFDHSHTVDFRDYAMFISKW